VKLYQGDIKDICKDATLNGGGSIYTGFDNAPTQPINETTVESIVLNVVGCGDQLEIPAELKGDPRCPPLQMCARLDTTGLTAGAYVGTYRIKFKDGQICTVCEFSFEVAEPRAPVCDGCCDNCKK